MIQSTGPVEEELFFFTRFVIGPKLLRPLLDFSRRKAVVSSLHKRQS